MTFGVGFVSLLAIFKAFLFSISFNRLLAPFNPTNSRVADDLKEGPEIDEAAQNATLKVMIFCQPILGIYKFCDRCSHRN